MLPALRDLEIVKNLYFVLGSVVGKGVSILALPLMIASFGAENFALYILVYAYVQFIALISVAGVNNALIPFWLEQENKAEFLAVIVKFTIVMSLVSFVPIAGALYFFAPLSRGISNPLVALSLILSYAFVYNFSVIGQALLRMESKQLGYFWVGVTSAVVFLTLLLMFPNATRNGVVTLILINIAVLLFQVALSFKLSDVPFRFGTEKRTLANSSKSILQFSTPLAAYMLVGSIPSIVDKWIIHQSFPMTVFAAYTLNFQFAFASNIISNVINIYNSPRVCELHHSRDSDGLTRNLQTNYILVALGTSCIGLVSYAYASMTNVSLTVGYWILLVAFGFSNIFALNTSVLVAEKRTILLSLIGLVGVAFFVATMTVAVIYDAPLGIYLSQLFCCASLASGSLLAIKGHSARRALA